MDRGGILLALALGLLAHVLIGYQPFPVFDDFAYGPLAQRSIDPTLFARDDQLRGFANHALVYEWIYRLGDAGPGVETVFRIAIWVQAALTAVALRSVLTGLGASTALLPAVLGLGVVVAVDGLGRGDFGGLISPFFHHHNVALTLVLAAFAASLYRRFWLAGTFLGLAVYAQPMTAFHGAIVAGLGVLAFGAAGVPKMAASSILVALPAAVPIIAGLLSAPPPETAIDLVDEAYRFRAPHHYQLPPFAILLTTLYLIVGWMAVALVSKARPTVGRFCLGAMAGFTLLHLVSVLVYGLRLLELPAFFILDANRSTPLLFAFAASAAAAGMMRGQRGPVFWALALLLPVVLAVNGTAGGIALVGLTAVLIGMGKLHAARPVALAGLGIALAFAFPPPPAPVRLSEPAVAMLDRIRVETPKDALFIIPIGLFYFRHYAQRSAYVDFKLFSVAQPDQAALTRARMERVARPAAADRSVAGWPGASLWEKRQQESASCERMIETLRETGADYYLRRILPPARPPACPDLPTVMEAETLILYRLPD